MLTVAANVRELELEYLDHLENKVLKAARTCVPESMLLELFEWMEYYTELKNVMQPVPEALHERRIRLIQNLSSILRNCRR